MRAILWLISRFAAIALLRAGPQDLPASRSLPFLALSGYFLVDLLQAWTGLGPARSLMAAVLDALLLAAFVQALLRAAGKPLRFPQTISALYGAGTLLGLLAVPLTWWLSAGPESMAGGSTAGMVLLILYLGWNLSVMAHVLRHALEFSFGSAMALSLLYFFLSQLIMALVLTGD